MGCVQTKSSPYTQNRSLEKLKFDSGFAKTPLKDPIKVILADCETENAKKIISRETLGNVSQRISKKISVDEVIDGWPKWLFDNISSDVLASLALKTADSYDKLSKVGQGTYSNVYKARDRDTGKIVALKKVRFNTSEPESIKFMAREIIILQKLDHPNIIKLEGIATSRMQYSLYLVFDFMQSDLTKFSHLEGKLTEPQVKFYMQQLLSGLNHCHERGILHRDIKGSNLLIDKNGTLKIADFGLANFYDAKQKKTLTSKVVTLWYRAPELLLGSTDYGVGIDLWSVGCIFAEMLMGRPVLPGRTEVEQLHRIFKLCGSPSEEYWQKMKPPTTFRPPQHYKPNFEEAFTNFPPSSFTLLTSLLSLDPSSRGTAFSALHSQFFSSSPLACDLSGLPIMIKDDDMPTQSCARKKGSRTNLLKNNKADSMQDLCSSKEEKGVAEPKLVNQKEVVKHENENISEEEIINKMLQHSPPPPPTPSFYSKREHYARSDAHPNATKNILNFHLSLTNSVNPIDDKYPRRSTSTVDFRQLDMSKVSKLFGLED